MALTSSLYRLIVADAWPSKDESERRLKVMVQRLVSEYGQAAVLARIHGYPVTKEQEPAKHWLLLTAWASAERQRGGTF